MTALHDLTALEQAAAIQAGEVSPAELVEHYLARIERWNERLGAFVTVTAEDARTAARQVADASGDEPASPLAGVPTAIKDLTLTRGVRTMLGSRAFAEFVPELDEYVVVRLRQAGLVSLGKTNTPEFGLPVYTEPDVAPPARTPYDLDRSAGGSSGGAAAAVAGGLVPFAHGNDGGGSLRLPASVCGLVGLKPARGRVSRGPIKSEGPGLAVEGPLARTVADAAALLDVLAGPMPGDSSWPIPPSTGTFLAAATRAPPPLRIARTTSNVLGVVPDPLCVTVFDEASATLEQLGHDVEDLPFDLAERFDGLFASFEVLWRVMTAAAPLTAEQESLTRPLTRWLRDAGRRLDGVSYARAEAALATAARQFLAATAAYDAVLTPTLAAPPAFVGQLRDDADPAADFAAQSRYTPYTSFINVTGQPAISLPLGWPVVDGTALPVGVQLIGRPMDEAGLLSLAGQLEAACPWRLRHPPCWEG